MPAKDLTGRVFGRWLVLSRAPNRGNDVIWLCRCDPEHGGCGAAGIPRLEQTASRRARSRFRDR